MSDQNNVFGNLGKMAESLKNVDFNLNKVPIDLSNINNNVYRNLTELPEFEIAHNPTFDLIERQEEANELLGKIVENTSVLKELVEINRETQLNSEELNHIMRAIHKVATAKDKDDADKLFNKALKAISNSGEAAGNISNLISLLMGIYNTVKPMIP